MLLHPSYFSKICKCWNNLSDQSTLSVILVKMSEKEIIESPNLLEQGSPIPTPWTGIGPWPIWSLVSQQKVDNGQLGEASSVSSATPHRSHYRLSYASCETSGSIRLSEEHEPYCELHMPAI